MEQNQQLLASSTYSEDDVKRYRKLLGDKYREIADKDVALLVSWMKSFCYAIITSRMQASSCMVTS